MPVNGFIDFHTDSSSALPIDASNQPPAFSFSTLFPPIDAKKAGDQTPAVLSNGKRWTALFSDVPSSQVPSWRAWPQRLG